MIQSLRLVKKFPWQKKTTSPDLVDETGTTFFPFFFLASLLISYKPKWNDIKKSNTGTQSSQSSQRILHSQISLVWKYHTGEECISCALIHLLRSDQQVLFTAKQAKRQNQLLTLFHYNIDRNKLLFLVSEKIYSLQCWWIVVDINWATEWQGKYPPLVTSTEVKYIVNYLL